MTPLEKLENKTLHCSTCDSDTVFDTIRDVECDVGIHTLIQCTCCGELFSVDGPCNAFQNLLLLLDSNSGILSSQEISDYSSSGHACRMN